MPKTEVKLGFWTACVHLRSARKSPTVPPIPDKIRTEGGTVPKDSTTGAGRAAGNPRSSGRRSKLTALEVKAITEPGRHADGNGLFLNVTPGGAKSWVLRYTVAGRRRSVGLGSYPEVGLADARELVREYKDAAQARRDPVTGRYRPPAPTFAEAARKVHALNRARWSSEHHANFWLRSLELHAAPLWDKRLDTIMPSDVITCLQPLWTEKPETMRRVRQRIQKVMRWGMAHDFIDFNPAGEKISEALPAQPRVKHHLRAVHYLDLPGVLSTIRNSQASMAVKGCIEFLALTAARSGEARFATWDEIDMAGAAWTVPAERMKRRIIHRVPLSARAMQVLETALDLRDGSGFIFPSPLRPGRPLPAETLLKSLRDHGVDATVHGMRSAFKTWAIEMSDATWAMTEAALAHRIGDATEAAYVRGDLFARRRALMEQWAQHLRTDIGSDRLAEQPRRSNA